LPRRADVRVPLRKTVLLVVGLSVLVVDVVLVGDTERVPVVLLVGVKVLVLDVALVGDTALVARVAVALELRLATRPEDTLAERAPADRVPLRPPPPLPLRIAFASKAPKPAIQVNIAKENIRLRIIQTFQYSPLIHYLTY
jgi:hypothetical protein